MNRRQALVLGGVSLACSLTGCSGDGSPGTDEEPTPSRSPTETDEPTDSPSPSPEETTISIVSHAEQPDVPAEFGAELAEPTVTAEEPARIRVTISNPTDSAVTLGEERAVQFRHVSSTESTLYLHPADDDTWESLVQAGCWRLTDHVAVPEYYGTISLDAGESVESESVVLGHPDLPEGDCLPDGDHEIEIEGVASEGEDSLEDGTEFTWGLTLRIGA